MALKSKIFMKGRTFGCVSNEVPLAHRFVSSRREHTVISCVGRCFLTYGIDHLSLLSVSDSAQSDLTCVCSDGVVYTGTAHGQVLAWRRSTVLSKTYPKDDKPVRLIYPFGRALICVSDSNTVYVWDKATTKVLLMLPLDESTFQVRCMTHPGCYIDKMLFASEQGTMQLWNLKNSLLVYTFKGWGSPVTALESAPALDVVAVGLSDGRIYLHNLKYDETLMDFHQDTGGITSMSFRTDGHPVLVSGSTSGCVVLWDLDERKVISQLNDGKPAHDGPISSVTCLPNEPIFVTSGDDNAIRVWIMDQSDGSARLLRYRQGHAAQPTLVRFSPSNPVHVISAGSDSSLRVFNLIHENMNFSMGRASYNRTVAVKKKKMEARLRMPPMVEMSISRTREKEWDNAVCRHKGSPIVTTWSCNDRRMGAHHLLPDRLAHVNRHTVNETAESLQLTNCGNFVVIGYSSGFIERFNVQSGIHRCTYGKPGHNGAVRGIAVGSLNEIVVSGCSRGVIKFWRFRLLNSPSFCDRPSASVEMDEPITLFRTHHESNLIAVALEDFSLRILDYETRKVVRKLRGHTGEITDAGFSSDARWLITASVDSTIRTWDIPTGSLIDILKTETPCVSLTLSPTGHHMVTAHTGRIGLYLWTNKTQFQHVSLRPMPTETDLSLEEAQSLDEVLEAVVEKVVDEDVEDKVEVKEQIQGLVTLSDLPATKWKAMVDHKLIRERNKEKSAMLTKPAEVPFFLPQLPASLAKDIQFDVAPTAEEQNEKNISRMSLLMITDRYKGLTHDQIINRLGMLSASSLHYELSSASPDDVHHLIDSLKTMFSTNKRIELAEAYLTILLNSQGTVVASTPSHVDTLKMVQTARKHIWEELEQKFMFCLSVVNFLKQIKF